jgi:hypothetical protein
MLTKDALAEGIPATMRAWALFGPGDLRAVTKPVPRPGEAEVLVKVEAGAARKTMHPVGGRPTRRVARFAPVALPGVLRR